MKRRRIVRAWIACPLLLAVGCGSSKGPGGSPDAGGQTAVAARIEVTPSALLLSGAGQERPLRARVLDGAGNELNQAVVWSSSTPAEVSVSSAGTVKAVGDLGSSVIHAVVGDVHSDPVLVVVAEPQPGALLVTDAQVVSVGAPIVGGPVAPDLGWDREVTLRLASDPAVGTVVLASESAAVAGKVVSTRRTGDTVVVRLTPVAIPDLLLRYHIHLEAGPDDLRVSPPPAQSRGGPDPSQRSALSAQGEGQLGALECSFNVGAGGVAEISNGLRVDHPASLVLDTQRTAPAGEKTLVFRFTGKLGLVGSLGIQFHVGVTASGSCEASTTVTLPVTGWFSALVTLGVPVGLGLAVDLDLDAVPFTFNLGGVDIGVSVDLGFNCAASTGCANTANTVTRVSSFTPSAQSGSAEDMKVKGNVFPYFLTGAKVSALLGAFEFGLLDVKVGPNQSFDFARPKKQADEAGYASTYKLDGVIEFSPASDVKKLAERVLGEAAAGEFLHSVPLTWPGLKSPHGSLTVDRARISASEKTTFTVRLSDLNYGPLGYNVKSVTIKRKMKEGPDYEDMQTLSAATDQDTFTWDWFPTADDAGENKFYAFVKTKLDVVDLEIGDDSLAKVEVVPFCGPLPEGTVSGSELLLTAASGGCTLNGTMQGSINGSSPTFSVDTRITAANVHLEEDPANSLPGQLVAFRAFGSWTLSHRGTVNDCVINSPGASGVLDGAPEQGSLLLDITGQPYAYTALIGTSPFNLHTTLDCPGDPPTHTEQDEPTALTVMSTLFSETTFTVTDGGVLDGTNTIGQGVTQLYQWHLNLQAPSPGARTAPPR